MSKPADIKIAHINPALNQDQSLDKSAVWEIFQNNNNEVIKHFFKFQQTWVNQSYKVFKDFDAYLVLLYLINKVFLNLSDRFHYMSFESFYNQEKLSIDKINLIEISKDLNIPKETIRRKVNFLQNKGIIYRSGKSIYCNVSKFDIQKPVTSIGLMAQVLSKFSNFLSKEKWFGSEINNEQIIKFIHEHFTVSWEYFFRFQIPYLTRHRTFFGDLESFNVWGSIGLVQVKEVNDKFKNDVIDNPKNFKDIFMETIRIKAKRGINASSISDISGIPRATVIRKLKNLQKRKLINRNKNLEYTLATNQQDLKDLEANYLTNQRAFSDYATTMYNLMKFSKLKIN
jgi:predicted transcriptional regulator